MDTTPKLSRREFMKISIGAGTGLVIGFSLAANSKNVEAAGANNKVFTPNAWLKISPENTVTVMLTESEMGQGVMTALPMLVAEELEVDWATIRVEHAPLEPVYGFQGTGGSTSVRNNWTQLRQAGAVARDMLITAAAQTWGIASNQCTASEGFVINTLTGERLSYGDLAEAAAKLAVPQTAFLKEPKDFKIIGKSMPLLDMPDKINGSAIFGSDINIPGMLVATIKHCPVFGGSLVGYDDKETKKIKGVKHVVQINNSIAVVADNYWNAQKGLKALKVTWNNNNNDAIDDSTIQESYQKAAMRSGEVMKSTGNIEHGLNSAATRIEASYEAPFEAHATMEPMCCTAYVHDGECEVWAPTQVPSSAEIVAIKASQSKVSRLFDKLSRKITGKSLQDVQIHTTFLGGGFGRRLEQDYVDEAVQISKAINKPVKLIWSREEDMQHDFYRPFTYHTLKAGLDKNGKPIAWQHRMVGPRSGLCAGGADATPYDIPNFHFDFVTESYPVPVGPWRSVSNTHNGFVIESFIDELAIAAKQDSFEFRYRTLKDLPRHKAVLKLAAEKSGWGKTTPNRHQGIALYAAYGSYVAQVAEVSVDANGEVRVHRVICAIDCGMVVNPDTVKAQMEGGIVFGLTACLKSSISIKNGRVAQSNFHDFPMLRIDEMPDIETYIVNSQESPGGVGEPGVPPIAAAVANAVYAATGIRVRKLPIQAHDLRPV